MPETDPPTRPFVLCADDYALSAGVDQAIIELASSGRLTAVGCLVQSPRWQTSAKALAELPTRPDIGLHFNLTEALGTAWHHSLSRLLVASQMRALPIRSIRTSLELQFNAFSEALQAPPDFLDGHRHVHQLAQIRDLLLEALARRGWQPWLRVTHPLVTAGTSSLKARLIAALGARQFGERCRQSSWPHNPAFAGIYGFDTDAEGYMALLRGWFAQIPAGTLFMCHPGADAQRLAIDPIAPARLAEYEVLRSTDFTRLLAQQGLHPATGSSLYKQAAPGGPAGKSP